MNKVQVSTLLMPAMSTAMVIADFAVAASNSDPRLTTDSGQAHIVFGGTTPRPAEFTLDDLNGADGFSITGVARLDGLAVRGAFGDFNGDGFDDILIGADFLDREFTS